MTEKRAPQTDYGAVFRALEPLQLNSVPVFEDPETGKPELPRWNHLQAPGSKPSASELRRWSSRPCDRVLVLLGSSPLGTLLVADNDQVTQWGKYDARIREDFGSSLFTVSRPNGRAAEYRPGAVHHYYWTPRVGKQLPPGSRIMSYPGREADPIKWDLYPEKRNPQKARDTPGSTIDWLAGGGVFFATSFHHHDQDFYTPSVPIEDWARIITAQPHFDLSRWPRKAPTRTHLVQPGTTRKVEFFTDAEHVWLDEDVPFELEVVTRSGEVTTLRELCKAGGSSNILSPFRPEANASASVWLSESGSWVITDHGGECRVSARVSDQVKDRAVLNEWIEGFRTAPKTEPKPDAPHPYGPIKEKWEATVTAQELEGHYPILADHEYVRDIVTRQPGTIDILVAQTGTGKTTAMEDNVRAARTSLIATSRALLSKQLSQDMDIAQDDPEADGSVTVMPSLMKHAAKRDDLEFFGVDELTACLDLLHSSRLVNDEIKTFELLFDMVASTASRGGYVQLCDATMTHGAVRTIVEQVRHRDPDIKIRLWHVTRPPGWKGKVELVSLSCAKEFLATDAVDTSTKTAFFSSAKATVQAFCRGSGSALPVDIPNAPADIVEDPDYGNGVRCFLGGKFGNSNFEKTQRLIAERTGLTSRLVGMSPVADAGVDIPAAVDNVIMLHSNGAVHAQGVVQMLGRNRKVTGRTVLGLCNWERKVRNTSEEAILDRLNHTRVVMNGLRRFTGLEPFKDDLPFGFALSHVRTLQQSEESAKDRIGTVVRALLAQGYEPCVGDLAEQGDISEFREISIRGKAAHEDAYASKVVHAEHIWGEDRRALKNKSPLEPGDNHKAHRAEIVEFYGIEDPQSRTSVSGELVLYDIKNQHRVRMWARVAIASGWAPLEERSSDEEKGRTVLEYDTETVDGAKAKRSDNPKVLLEAELRPYTSQSPRGARALLLAELFEQLDINIHGTGKHKARESSERICRWLEFQGSAYRGLGGQTPKPGHETKWLHARFREIGGVTPEKVGSAENLEYAYNFVTVTKRGQAECLRMYQPRWNHWLRETIAQQRKDQADE